MEKIQTEVRPHAVRDYLNSRSEASRATMRTALRRALAVAANCDVDDIDPAYLASDEVIVNFQNMNASMLETISRKLQKKYSQRTAALTISAVKGVMKKLKREGKISASDYIDVIETDNPRIPKDEAKRRFLDEPEIHALKKIVKADKSEFGKRDYAILAWMLTSGARCGEVVTADLKDYNPKTGELLIRDGKGMKSRMNQLHNGAKTAMNDWLKIRGKKPGALFSRIKRGGENFKDVYLIHENMTPHSIVLMLRKRADQAGVKRFSPHALRRTAGETLITAGVPIEDVATILGHSDLNTTREKYTRKNVRKALDAGAVLQF